MANAKKTTPPVYEAPAARRKARPTVLVRGLQVEALRRSVLESAREFGWTLLDLDILNGVIPDDPAPKGALLTSVAPVLYRQLHEVGCSLVEIVSLIEPWRVAWPVVAADLVAQGRIAAGHFFERGFLRVAFVGHDPWSDARLVYDGFHARAAELGLTCGLHQLITPAEDEKLSRAALFRRRERQIGDWLRSLPKPVGVFTYGDTRAGMLCVAAQRAGLAVPEEVAILGRGNDPYACEVSPVMLSSIDVNNAEMGRQAARLLQRLMEGEAAPPAPILIPPAGIVERQSTSVLATPDPVVVAALRYMWDHLDLDLSVNDIACTVGVPRHRLERAFRKHLDRGINEELRRKRLDLFRELLTTTAVPISKLAPRAGFRTMVHLQRSFRRAYGMSPRQWRVRTAN